LAAVGCEPFKGTAEQLAAIVRDDLVRWSRLVSNQARGSTEAQMGQDISK
jgi:hypothetical protein